MANFVDKQFGRLGNRLFQLAYIYAQFREGKIPDIYLQNIEYFDKYREELRQLFRQEGEPLDYVSIHVRIGENPSVPNEPRYENNPFYVNLLNTDYYKKAMEQFPNEKFMLFSDDPNWLESQKIFNCTFSNGTELEDFSRMSRCKGHIIANSSFSFWASYIGGGKTISPKQWFSDGIDRVGMPEEWIKI